MSFIPRPQEVYKHFKGNLYQIVAIAEHSETGEALVIYQALYGDFRIYARPLAMFTEKVDKEKYPGVEQEYRFELQGNVGAVTSSVAADAVASEPVRAETVTEETIVTTAVTSANVTTGTATSEAAKSTTAASSTDEKPNEESQSTAVEEEYQLDPMVLEFLDADTYEQRLNILAALHHRITDEMITTMAIASDVEVMDGDIEERYESLKNCLLTLEKYESNRLR